MGRRAAIPTLMVLLILAASAPLQAPAEEGGAGTVAPAVPARQGDQAVNPAPEGEPSGGPEGAAAPAPVGKPAAEAVPGAPPAGEAAEPGAMEAGPFVEAPPEPPPPEGILHTVVPGDTLWDLAGRYLGSPWLWPEVWEKNRFLTNPHYIYPGIRVLIVPPAAKEYAFEVREEAPAAVPAVEEAEEVPPPAEAPPAAQAPRRMLDITHGEYVRAGEFLLARPAGIGRIRGGEEPKVVFSEGDRIFLALDREIPDGQLLGVYRVRGPVRAPAGRRLSGYVKHLVGVIQVTGRNGGVPAAVVKKSFEDLLRTDLVAEEIPAYTPVYIEAGGEGVDSTIIAGRSENRELAAGDVIFLDRGAAAGIAPGNVFRLYRGGVSAELRFNEARSPVRVEVGRAVVVKALPETSTAYVVDSTQSFEAGIFAAGGAGPPR